jgi:hypothetical protein
MPPNQMRPTRGLSDEARELEEAARESIDDLRGIPILSYSEVSVSVVAGDNTIPHKLKRRPKGWIITDMTVGAVTLRRVDWDTGVITLNSSGTATISMWVY